MTRYRLIHQPTGQAVAAVTRAEGWWAKGWGVLGRRALEPGEGLWLPGVASVHTVGVRFPLDLLFLDGRFQTVRLSPDTPTGRWLVHAPGARHTLELGAGTLAQVVPAARAGETWELVAEGDAGETHERRFPEALAELRLAMRLDPRNADAHDGLGELLAMQSRFRPAVAEYREAIRMSFYTLGAWIGLPAALDQCGQYDEAIRACREADRLLMEQEQANGETEPVIHDATADAYLHKKDWADSIAESNASLGYNPNDACAHENLAEAYIAQGRKGEARAEWARAISLGDPGITPVARKLLAAHP